MAYVIALAVGIVIAIISTVVGSKNKEKEKARQRKLQDLALAARSAERQPEKKKAPVRKQAFEEFETIRPTVHETLKQLEPEVHETPVVATVEGAHHEEHCAVTHDGKDKYIVEKVEVSGSIEGKSTEGCEEHYDVRFVKAEEEEEKQIAYNLTQEAIRRAIVLGEVINDPAYKKDFSKFNM